MKFLAICALACCLYAPLACSQCSGMNLGGGCVPPPCAPGSPLFCNQAPQRQPQPAPQPHAVWADRWEAVATDPDTGGMGAAEGKKSKAEAQQIALEICASHGATHCVVNLAIYNQCGAIAQNTSGGQTGYAGAPIQKQAEELAIAQCGHGNSCKIVYSGCSFGESPIN
jgi:hypothetical protein